MPCFWKDCPVCLEKTYPRDADGCMTCWTSLISNIRLKDVHRSRWSASAARLLRRDPRSTGHSCKRTMPTALRSVVHDIRSGPPEMKHVRQKHTTGKRVDQNHDRLPRQASWTATITYRVSLGPALGPRHNNRLSQGGWSLRDGQQSKVRLRSSWRFASVW
ncbi:hypothetical protein OH77DRAFT_1112831 [Trametes cingulata]|nr:hypothetical protein OH77DRAFT_1112831 [Trametes cingulata]